MPRSKSLENPPRPMDINPEWAVQERLSEGCDPSEWGNGKTLTLMADNEAPRSLTKAGFPLRSNMLQSPLAEANERDLSRSVRSFQTSSLLPLLTMINNSNWHAI